MTTEYRVRLDRETCDGIFACLVRDDRFVEDDGGLATIEGATESGGSVVETFHDDRLADAQQAADACPVDAIAVEVSDNE
ncbi:MAG: ferredoxin [Haloarculaceae archaeon]